MKSAFPVIAVVFALLVANPAQACRVRTAPSEPEIPPPADLIVFTATIDQRWDDRGHLGADLRVLETFLGDPGTRVDATWSGIRYSVLTIDDQGPQVLAINSCAGTSIYDDALRTALMGAVVAVMARRTPTGVDVQDLAPADSEKGRALLGLANP